jgi:hypothetical protein
MARVWNTDAERARWQRRNERARELGYSSASQMAKARKAGTPSALDTDAAVRVARAGDTLRNGAVRQRGFVQATLRPDQPAQTRAAAARTVRRSLGDAGPGGRVTITVQTADGPRTVTPAGGLTAQQLDQLLRDYGGAAGLAGVAGRLAWLAGYDANQYADDDDDDDDDQGDDDDGFAFAAIDFHVSE